MLDRLETPQYEKYAVNKGNPVPVNIYVILFFVSIALLYGHEFMPAAGFIVILVTLFTLRTGTEVNITASQYRDYFKIFFKKFGTWKRLSAHDYILLSRSMIRKGAVLSVGISTSTDTVYYDVDLITKGNRDVILYRSASRDEALLFAQKLSVLHKLKISERISNGYVWLE